MKLQAGLSQTTATPFFSAFAPSHLFYICSSAQQMFEGCSWCLFSDLRQLVMTSPFVKNFVTSSSSLLLVEEQQGQSWFIDRDIVDTRPREGSTESK